MLRQYIRGAMGRAHYEILEEDGTYYAEIPEFEGAQDDVGPPRI